MLTLCRKSAVRRLVVHVVNLTKEYTLWPAQTHRAALPLVGNGQDGGPHCACWQEMSGPARGRLPSLRVRRSIRYQHESH